LGQGKTGDPQKRLAKNHPTEGFVDGKGIPSQAKDGSSHNFMHAWKWHSLGLYGKRGRRMCDQLNGPFDARPLNPDGRTAEMSSFLLFFET